MVGAGAGASPTGGRALDSGEAVDVTGADVSASTGEVGAAVIGGSAGIEGAPAVVGASTGATDAAKVVGGSTGAEVDGTTVVGG